MDPTTQDVAALIEQVVAAARGGQWIVAIPLMLIASIAAFRRIVVPMSPRLGFFATDRGGALLALVGSVAASIAAAAATPGATSAASVALGAIMLLAANQAIFGWLRKLISPTGAERAQVVAAGATATGAASAAAAGTSDAAAAAALDAAVGGAPRAE